MKTFYVEYEVLPTRAINHTYFEAERPRDILDQISKEHSVWKIRKIEKCCPSCQCRINKDGCGCNPPDA